MTEQTGSKPMVVCGVDPSFTGFCASLWRKGEIIDWIFVSTEPGLQSYYRISIIISMFAEFISGNLDELRGCIIGVERPIYKNTNSLFIQCRLF